MNTKDGTAEATLTDVKNKTGDVFALADEFGEVIITSYNKPKYMITRLSRFEKPTTPQVEEPTSANPKRANPMKISNDIVGIFSGISAAELWDRNSRKEISWVRKTRKSYY